MTDLCPSCREPLDYPSGDGCAAMTLHQPVMTEDRVAKAVELLERIAAHDHQAAAIRILINPPACPFERIEAYADCLNEVANTDIQGWAQQALLHLKGEDQ
jgi:LSD1 subclass zinc finger protein